MSESQLIQLLLASPAALAASDIAKHAEDCLDCQHRLEELAGNSLDWNDLRGLLQPPESYDEEQAVHSLDEAPNQETNARAFARAPAFLQPSSDPSSLGRFGRYEVQDLLGAGGMGIVMRGYDPALNRHSAIKVLAPHLACNAAARRRFSREAKSAAAVVHPHVVPIQNVDEEEGLPYLVMPVIDGGSLEQRVINQGPQDIKEILRVGLQIASGLAAAHRQGLVHRDVKPENILLEQGVERVLISDFGLARAVDDANQTQSGIIAGTPHYMSPEQAQGQDVGPKSDLFSLGCVLYFMATGHSPFRADSTMGVLHRIVNNEPRPVRSINCDLPRWFEEIVARLLQKDPNQRFDSADQVGEILANWLAHLQQPQLVPAPATKIKPTRLRPRTFYLMSLVFLTLLGIGSLAALGFSTWGKRVIVIDAEVTAQLEVRRKSDQKLIDAFLILEGESTRLRLPRNLYQVQLRDPDGRFQVENGLCDLATDAECRVVVRRVATPGVHIPLGPPAEPPHHPLQVIAPAGSILSWRQNPKGSKQHSDRTNVFRMDCVPGSRHEFQLTSDVYPEKRLALTIDLQAPADSRILDYNAIGIRISRDEIDQCASGEFLRKIYFHTADQPAIQVVLSTRLAPGIDPVQALPKNAVRMADVRMTLDRSPQSRTVHPLSKYIPGNAIAAISIPDLGETVARWQRTDLAQLLNMPDLQPFIQQQTPWAVEQLLGVNEDFANCCLTLARKPKLVSGLSLAWLPSHPEGDTTPVVAIAILRDSQDNPLSLPASLQTDFDMEQFAIADPGIEVRAFRFPSTPLAGNSTTPGPVVIQLQNKLAVCESLSIAESIVACWNDSGTCLANSDAFVNAKSRWKGHATDPASGPQTHSLEFFFRPLPCLERLEQAINTASQKKFLGRRTTAASLLAKSGFGSLVSLVGHCDFERNHQLEYECFLFCDGPRNGSLNTLQFDNSLNVTAPPYMSEATAATFAVDWELQSAFSQFEDFVDQLVGATGVFHEVLEGIRLDPNGPQVDVVGELLPLFSGKGFLLTECVQVDAEHHVLVLEVTHREKARGVLERLMSKEPDLVKRTYGDQIVWSCQRQGDEGNKALIPSWSIALLDDACLFSPNANALQAAMARMALAKESALLIDRDAERAIFALRENARDSLVSAWQIQTERSYRATYAKLRTGRLDEMSALIGRLARLASGEKPSNLDPKLPLNRLPEFEIIRPWLAPSGFSMTTQREGWLFRGVLLRNSSPVSHLDGNRL